MLKLASVLSVLGLLAIAGCGGGSDGGESPLDNALGYLPADAPFVVAIDTDVDGGQFEALDDAVGRFDSGDQLSGLLQGALEDRAGDIEKIEAALGNPFVVGSTDAKSFVGSDGEDNSFVGAIQASSEDALNELLDAEKPDEDGESNGATLYKDDSGDSFAIEGETLVVAGSKAQLERALEVRDGDDRMTEDDFDTGLGDVPAGALLRVYLDVEALLDADPKETAQARRVKWVAALRTAGIGLSLEQGKVSIDVNVNTDPDGLTDADLPIASGAAAPQVLDRGGQIAVALRDPAQVIAFARSTARALDPDGYGTFEAGLAQIERRIDVDVEDDLLSQLEGNLAVSVDVDGTFGARAELESPQKFERSLARLAEVLPDIAEGAVDERIGFAEPGPGEDFYALATAGGDRVVFGVVDGALLIANSPAVAGQLAAAGTEAVAGADGALVATTDAEQLLNAIVGDAGDEVLGQLGAERPDLNGIDPSRLVEELGTEPLDRLTGSVEASTSGLSGSFELTLDRDGSGGGQGGGGSGGGN